MINLDEAGSDRYPAEDPGSSVVMLNLLRLAPGGAETYMSYMQNSSRRESTPATA